MAFIRKRRPWDSQPQEAVGPNPASTGLIVYIDPAIDPRVNGKFPTSNPTTPIVGANGRGLQFTGGNKKVTWAFDAGLAAAVTGPSGFTAALLFDLDAATNYGGLLSFQNTTTSGAAFEIRLGASASTDTKIQVLRATSETYRAKDTGENRFSAGDKNIVLVVSFPDNDVTSQGTAWINGTAYPLNSGAIGSATGTVGTPTTGSLVLGGRGPDSVTYLDGKVYALRIWDRELSASEVPKTPEDMWSLAAPQTILVPVSAGGGGGATISATPGNAVADGTTASLTRTIPATPGNASADGITAAVVQVIGAAPGNAAADGATAAVTRTIATTPGNAVADGVTATISTAGTTTISCTPGNAVADGVTATIAGTTVISCAPGNAVADGVAATVTNGASAAGGMGFEMGGSKKRRIVKIRWNGYDYTLDRDALPAFLESIEEQAEEKVTKKRNAKKKPAPLARIVSAPADVMPDLKERIAAVNRSIGALWGTKDDEEEEEILWLMV